MDRSRKDKGVGGFEANRGGALPWFLLGLLVIAVVAGAAIWHEAQTSKMQSRYFSELGREMSWSVADGPSDSIRFPTTGPFDLRMGYTAIPRWQLRLQDRHFATLSQARMAPRMLEVMDRGWFAPYREKHRAGLRIDDCHGEPLYLSHYPQRSYASFADIPPLLVSGLLFIENRELLSNEHAMRNPAVEWDRFLRAAVAQAERKVWSTASAPGGSTLATQIEKFRHSAGGRTESGREKIRQMASASLRAYLDGPDTTLARHRLVLDYINTVPLAAWPGYGEVNGLGDGLWVWYGRDFDEVNALLHDREAPLTERALAYKQALSLLVSQRRPSGYLAREAAALDDLTDVYVRLSAQADLIPADLAAAALAHRLERRSGSVAAPRRSFIEGKAATAVRSEVAGLLGLSRLYELDRLDLDARSTLDHALQGEVTRRLRSLSDPAEAAAAGLTGERLLAGSDPAQVRYSFTLIERTGVANAVRVQVDTLDQPLDINSGIKLDLGSTAKLRTLVTYLQQVAALHERLAALPADQLRTLDPTPRDPVGRWAVEHLLSAPDGQRDLATMLEAALDRRYSASPYETFFTGGGAHTFGNFDPLDDSRTLSVSEALDRSVNLVFVRLMRDVVSRAVADLPGISPTLLDDPRDPQRVEYLARFADREGTQFLARFHRKYARLDPEQSRELLLRSVRPTPRRLAVIFRTLEPDAPSSEMAEFIRRAMPAEGWADTSVENLYEKYAPERFGLQDRGYLAGVHPLELWLVAYLERNPGATLGQVLLASSAERQEVYGWLFKTRHKRAQDMRIRSLIEADAFAEIHRSWRRLGYPFDSMTPSYGAALGSSGDRPAALAELVGILLNDGLHLPTLRVDRLLVARDTPYETHFGFVPNAPGRVLPPEVARAALGALARVVERGTARRLAGVFRAADGTALVAGGKTGTGDHRAEVHGKGGVLLSKRVVSRSGTFVFFLGDRYFGTLTAYVTGPEASRYSFTSALPTQILKTLAPVIQPAVDQPAVAGTACGAGDGATRVVATATTPAHTP
jgi:membrane peptidoglycan carboxypeptidase